jgi:hypothetical protein
VSAFVALSNASDSLPSKAPSVRWTVIQSADHPLGAAPPLHPVHARLCSWATIGADHMDVLDPCHLQQYLKLLQTPQLFRSPSL